MSAPLLPEAPDLPSTIPAGTHPVPVPRHLQPTPRWWREVTAATGWALVLFVVALWVAGGGLADFTSVGESLTNLVALTVFLPMGLVLFKVGAVIAVANLIGGYVGARTAVSKGSGFVRAVFVLIVSAFIVKISGSLIGWWA